MFFTTTLKIVATSLINRTKYLQSTYSLSDSTNLNYHAK